MPITLPARLASLALLACAVAAHATTATTDLRWLQRLSFGADSATLQRFDRLGRSGYLDAQLRAQGDDLPPDVAAHIAGLDAERLPATALLQELAQARQRLRQMDKNDPQRRALRRTLRKRGHELAAQAAQAELLRALYDRNQLRERMVWFWLNHFSVFQRKGPTAWFVADYADRAIRPHALGRFRDLVMATLTSPAMLVYLDNARNARGHLNENYARELMELHTLGVDAGYTQQDVQALAHILTGLAPDLRGGRARHRGARGDGIYVFLPRRHDGGDKVLLGRRIRGGGFDEIERAVDRIVRQPACARFISAKLARYILGTAPPPALVARMSATFARTDGDIAAVLRTLFTDPDFDRVPAQGFKDPMLFVVSAARLAYDGHRIDDTRPLLRALQALGEPLFGRQTPDGWPLDARSWSSSGQLSRRFEIARALASGRMPLFAGGSRGPVPEIETGETFRLVLAPSLGAATRAALAASRNRVEWNTFLLASPEFNAR